MSTTRFCSLCGQKVKARRAGILFTRSLCAQCKSGFPAIRLAWLIALFLASSGSFLIGRHTAPDQPFHFIGTPVDVNAGSLNQAPAKDADARSATVTEDLITSCAAPTKAGPPCRRKVQGWGYCWQHRDKFGKKRLPNAPERLPKIEQGGLALP